MKMYMVTHKAVDFIPKGRIPIFVGNGENTQGYISDNSGDNISNKNKNYCELTALYWIWKNSSSSDSVAIEHYRRFFMDPQKIFPTIISQEKINKLVSDGKVVVPMQRKWAISIGEHYKREHSTKDFNNVHKIIMEEFPDYIEDFDFVMNGDKAHMYNMAALSKDLFDNYCGWLFKILFELEKITDLSGRSPYQQRAYGFLSERLFNVWLHHNIDDKDIVQLPVYILSNTKIKTILSNLKNKMVRRREYVPKKTNVGLKQ